MLLHPDLELSSGPYRVDVETASELTRGMSTMAWAKFGLEPNATVVEEVDSAGFYGLLAGMLATPTTPNRPISGLDQEVGAAP